MSTFQISLLFFLFFLTIPVVLRSFILIKQKTFSFFIGVFCGFAQDLIIVYEQAAIFYMASTYLWSRILIFPLFLLISIYYLLDYYYYQQTTIRFHISYCRHLTHPKSFISSAKAFGLNGFIWLSCVLIIFTGLIVFLIKSLDLFFLPILFYCCISISILSLFLPKKITYTTNNGIFQAQVFLLKYLLFFWRKSIFNEKNNICNWSGEKASSLSINYPHLRYTKGFKNKKLAEIDIKKGEKPHIIIVFMESFRAKNIGCLNADIPASPCFDALSTESHLFSNFYSNGVLTDKAIISSLFGILPIFQSQFLSYYEHYPIIGIPQITKNHGYKNIYIHNGHLTFDNQSIFFQNHGFEKVIGHNTIKKAFKKTDEISWGIHDEYLMKYAINTLIEEDKNNNPCFLCLFTISNHHPWENPPKTVNKQDFSSLPKDYQKYLDTFAYSDYALGQFVEQLKKNNLSKNSVVIVLADHGQPMGEHNNNYSLQKYLYEENIHIPLLFFADGRIKEPKVIDKLSSQVDLVPTIMDILYLDGFQHSFGSSLFREEENKKIYFNNPYEHTYFGMRQNQYKYIYCPSTQKEKLFNIEEDNNEKNNLISKNKAISSEMKQETIEMLLHLSNLYKKRKFTPKELLLSKRAFIPNKDISNKLLLQQLTQHKDATYVDISNCLSITDDVIETISSIFPNLTYINISNCSLITDKSLISLSDNCKKLLHVNISCCPLLTDRGISYLLSKCFELECLIAKDIQDVKTPTCTIKSKLLNLDLYGCKNLSNQGLINISSSCPQLQFLKLNCNSISDKGFLQLAKNCRKIQAFIGFSGENISDGSMSLLFKNNPYLTSISLESFSKLTDTSLHQLKNKTLNIISISNCDNITDIGLSSLISSSLIDLQLISCQNIKGQFLLQTPTNAKISIYNCINVPLKTLQQMKNRNINFLTDRFNI